MRQELPTDSDSEDEYTRWRAEYAEVQRIENSDGILNEYSAEDLPEVLSDASHRANHVHEHSTNGSHSMSEDAQSSHDETVGIDGSPEGTISEFEEARINLRDLLLNHLDDKYATEEDLFDYQEIIDDLSLPNDGPGNRLRQILVDEDANDVMNARVNVSKVEIL
ncbi:uncharacterized protein LOC131675431 isoform X2 [Phymastichus coffea]|nr:uncharacterized protein LOC131675431 isoform X2 [Phymastichus coffea]